MELYLIRHGECGGEGSGSEGPPLTHEGNEQVRRISSHILELGAGPSALYCSPLLRAIQTAESFSKVWGLQAQCVDWLLPGASPATVLQKLREMQNDSLALVGHLPNLGLLLGVMVWGLPPKEVLIPRGGVAFLHFNNWDPGTAKLKWLLSPDAFAMLPPS